MKLLLRSFLVIALFTLIKPLSAQIIYVNGSHKGSEDGNSWFTPYNTIQEALDRATPGTEIWLAAGEYSSPENISDTANIKGMQYILNKNVSFFGGFKGVESSKEERNISLNKTLLTGKGNLSNLGVFFLKSPNLRIILDGISFTDVSRIIEGSNSKLSPASDIKILNCEIFNIKGGVGSLLNLYNEGKLTLDNCNIHDNDLEVYIVGGVFTSLNILNSTFRKNLGYGNFIVNKGEARISNCVVDSCNNRWMQFVDYGNVYIEDCIIQHQTSGTPIEVSSANNVTLKNSRFLNNEDTGYCFYYGGIQELIIEDVKFTDNKCSSLIYGGGIYSQSKYPFILRNFESKRNKISGDGIYVPASNGRLIQNCSFENDTVDNQLIEFHSYNTDFDNVSIVGCKAMNFMELPGNLTYNFNKLQIINSEFTGSAGGIWVGSDGKGEMTNSLLRKNIGDYTLFNSGGVFTFKNTVIDSNYVKYNGLINLFNGSSSAPKEFINCKFNDNFSLTGTSVINSSTNLNILNCEFNRNKGNSGTINQGGSTLKIYGSRFYRNEATYSGAVLNGGGGYFETENSLFIENIAESSPVFNLSHTSCLIKNSLIYGNIAKQSLGYDQMYGTFQNTIYWNNSLPLKKDPGQCTIRNSNIQGGFPGVNILDIDPKFIDPDNGNFRLSCESPLLNKGSNEYVTTNTDKDGLPRIMGDTVDIGPYEFQGDPNVSSSLPAPSFEFSNSNPCKLEEIKINNTTKNKSYYSYKWEPGDGTPLLSGEEFSYKYILPGNYISKLTATNSCGKSVSVTKSISIRQAFVPEIFYKTTICAGDTSSFFTNATCTNLVWSVTGGTIKTGQGTSRIYVQWGNGLNGNGKVKLVATGCGNSDVCEFPVEVEIPIVPSAINIKGTELACSGTQNVYITDFRHNLPGAVYKWRVKKGSIIGKEYGYNLDSINIQWNTSSADTLGTIYLDVIHEVLPCTLSDSMVVGIRPSFSISQPNSAYCPDSKSTLYKNVPGYFTWSIDGKKNTVDTSGVISLGSDTGLYYVHLKPVISSNFCRSKDSVQIKIIESPIIDSITGVSDIDTISYYTYTGYMKGVKSRINFTPYNYKHSFFSSTDSTYTLRWSGGAPLGFYAIARTIEGYCPSDTFKFNVKRDFVYTISGEADVCISDSGTYNLNEDPDNTSLYEWKFNNVVTGDNKPQVKINFNNPGYNTLSAKITRKGKEYPVSKNILVNALGGQITVDGPKFISPAGGGTYKYKIENKSNYLINYEVQGAVSHNLTGDTLTITWDNSGPYSIKVKGSTTNETCTTVPFTLYINKAPALNEDIVLENGFTCPDTKTIFKIDTDEKTENVTWALTGGGTIINSDKKSATVLWGNMSGDYELSVKYERFGTHTIKEKITVHTSPAPEITDAIVCEGKGTKISTTASFNKYYWTAEPKDSIISQQPDAIITRGGYFKVKVTDLNGCEAAATKLIRFVPKVETNITPGTTTYCEGTGTNDVQLATIEGANYKYQWYKDGIVLTGDTLPVLNFTQNLSVVGNHSYKVISKSEVCANESTVTYTVLPKASCGDGGGNPGGGGDTCKTNVSFTVSGCSPVSIINNSVQTTDFLWKFGDGSTSTDIQPVAHTYNNIGIYTISLINGCASQRENIEVPVIAKFAVPDVVCQGAETQFKDYSLNLPGRKITSWKWNFGDGKTIEGTGDAGRSTSHIYTAAGDYVATLTVNGNDSKTNSCSNTYSLKIKVNAAPVVDFAVTEPACNSTTYNFKNNSTQSTKEAKYEWNLGDGFTAGSKDAAAKYAIYGNKTILLKVTDYLTCSNQTTTTITVKSPVETREIVAPAKTKICNGDSLLLTSPISEGAYTWYRDNINLNNNSRTLYAKKEGNYSVTYIESSCSVNTKAVEVQRFNLDNTTIKTNVATCTGDNVVISIPGVYYAHTVVWTKDFKVLPYVYGEFAINGLSSTNSGLYGATVKEIESGCTYTLPSKQITVSNKPAKPVLSSTRPAICYQDSSAVFYTNPIAQKSLEWSINKFKTSDKTDTITLNNLQYSTIFNLKVIDKVTGCSSVSDDYTVKVGNNITPRLSGNINACERTFVSVSTGLNDSDYKFNWFRNGKQVSNVLSRLDFASIAFSDTGKYFATIISNGKNGVAGCEFKTDTIEVKVKKAPEQPIISGKTEFCTGSSLIITSSVKNNIIWSNLETTQSIAVYKQGSYTVTATDTVSGCKSRNTLTITENPLPDFSFVSDGTYEKCASDPINFSGLSSYQYQWKLNGTNVGKPNTPLSARKSGKYTVYATTDKGCSDVSDTLRIKAKLCGCIVLVTGDTINTGSLRDAINCANDKKGLDNITFKLEGTGPFTIVIDSTLPVIKDPVILDGFSQSGDGRYDIVIKGGKNKSSALVFESDASSESEIRGLVFSDFDNSIHLGLNSHGNLIERNQFTGTTKQNITVAGVIKNTLIRNNSFASDGKGEAIRMNLGEGSNVSDNTFENYINPVVLKNSDNNTFTGNKFNNIKATAVTITDGSDLNQVTGNTFISIDSNAIVLSGSENKIFTNLIGINKSGIISTIGKTGIVGTNAINSRIFGNTILATGADGILLTKSFGSYVTGNNIGKYGSFIKGTAGNAISADRLATITGNIITSSAGYGIYLTGSSFAGNNILTDNNKGGVYVIDDSVRISANVITNTNKNLKAIDLHNAANTNKVPAIFSGYQLNENYLILSGKSAKGDSVEIFVTENAPQQALKFAGKAGVTNGTWSIVLPKGPLYNPEARNYYVNTASAGRNTSELSNVYTTGCYNCKCPVVIADNEGIGSLRAAIDSAHDGACRFITFDIQPSVITLETPLRELKVPVVIQGKDGIIINGKSTGTAITATSDKITVSKLAFTNWNTAIELNGDSAVIADIKIDKTKLPVTVEGNSNSIENSCINCTSDSSNAYPISAGIVVNGTKNTIGKTGKGNKIVDAFVGINVNTGNSNSLFYNTILGADTAIQHTKGGNNNYPVPANLIATLKPDTTGILAGKSKAGDRIQVFISDYTGKPVELFVTETTAASDNWTVLIPQNFIKPDENIYLVVTATDVNGNTSEISPAVKLGNKPAICYVTNTLNKGKGSLRSAVDCANEAGKRQGAPAKIVFRLPATAANLIEVADSGFVLANQFGVTIDPASIPVELKGKTRLPYAFSFETNGNTINKLNFQNFQSAIKTQKANNTLITANTFAANDTAVSFRGPGKITAKANTISTGTAGIYISDAQADISSNTFGNTTGTSVSGFGIILKNSGGSYVNSNNIRNITGTSATIDAKYNGKAIVIEGGAAHNILNNIVEAPVSAKGSSVLLEDIKESTISNNRITNGETGMEINKSIHLDVNYNKFISNGIYGINLISSEEIHMTTNTTNALPAGASPINLNYKKATESNKGIAPPTFTYATYKKKNLIIRGKTEPYHSVEIFETDTIGIDLLLSVTTVKADKYGQFEYVSKVNPENINDRTFRATATVSPELLSGNMNYYTSEASPAFNPRLKICYVTTESDANEKGTLRYNLHLANKDECNLMLFEVDGHSNVTISPDSTLPVIRAKNLTIDATSQPGYNSSPVVFLKDNHNFNNAFDIKSKGAIAIHGLAIADYNETIILDSISNFEVTLSSFENFDKPAIAFNADTLTSARLDSNTFTSQSAVIALALSTPDAMLRNNVIKAGSKHAIDVQVDNITLIGNKIEYNNPLPGTFAIKAHDVDSLAADGNIISKYPNGIDAKRLKSPIFGNNSFPEYSATNPLRFAIRMDSCINAKVLGSRISYADTGIVIKNSRKVDCSGNEISIAVKTGLYIYASDSSLISSNQVSKSVYGILLDSSRKSILIANRIFNHDSAGVVIDILSDSVKFNSNKIGSESIENDDYSKGAGLIVYSSGNIIGEADTSGNVFSNNMKGGVIIDSAINNKITYNVFWKNDSSETRYVHFAIDHLNNGNKLKKKPTISTYSVLDRNKGVYMVSGVAEAGDSIHIYRSEGFYQGARYFVGETVADISGKWNFRLDTTDTVMFRKPFKWKTITLVATATDPSHNTSKLSDIFYLGHCFVTNNLDNTDNEFPYPNSFRQAVLCANAQPEKSAISFAIDGFTGFDIPIEQEMISFTNTSGLTFNGKNLINNLPVKAFNGSEETTLFWQIADTAGSSEFSNFKIQNFDTSMYFSGKKTIEFNKFDFLNVGKVALLAGDSSGITLMDSLKIQDSQNGGLLIVNPHATKVVLSGSEISQTKFGVKADSTDSLFISKNKFTKPEIAIEINKINSVNISENDFDFKETGTISWNNSSGLIKENKFEEDTIGITLSVSNSKKVQIESNEFKNQLESGIWLSKVDSSSLIENSFPFVKTYAVKFDTCTNTRVYKNTISSLKGTGFALVNSEKITISENRIERVSGKDKALAKLIQLNKQDTSLLSNHGHPEPEIKGYLVKREKDCSEEHLGMYLFGKAVKNDLVEIFFSDTLYTTFSKYIGNTETDTAGNWQFKIPKTYYDRNPKFVYSFTATGTDTVNNTSVEAPIYKFNNIENRVVVKYTADTGVGTLRRAVEDINCSDIFTRVYFEIEELAPYRIELKDTLPVINAFRGFTMDGITQSTFNKVQGKTGIDSSIYIAGTNYQTGYAIFRLNKETDSSKFANLVFSDVSTGIRLENSADKINKLRFIKTGSVKGDTAIVISGKGDHMVENSNFVNYKKGVHLTNETDGNNIKNNDFASVNLAVLADKGSSKNRIDRNTIQSDSIGILLNGLTKINYVTKNTFGSVENPVTVTSIKLHNSSSQFIGSNHMPAGKLVKTDSLLAFIEISDSSHSNQIMNNLIGITDSGFVRYKSEMIGIRVKPQTSELRLGNNVISSNQIAGLKVPAIFIQNADGGSVQGNFIGVDSAFVQRENKQDYSMVSGIDTTSIILDSTTFISINANTIVNFGDYALDVRKSEDISITANKMFSEKSKLKAINLNLNNPQLVSNNGIVAPVIDSTDVLSADKIAIYGKTIYPNSRVQIFEGFAYQNDTLDHSLRFIKTVDADAIGNFSIELPSSNFGFNKYNKYISQVSVNARSSEFSRLYTVEPLLCKLHEKGIDLLAPSFNPCPDSDFKIDAVLDGLSYKWSAPQLKDTIRTRVAQIDTTANVTLQISDQFNCKHTELINVVYKGRPRKPKFIVSSNTFVGDTIVLVDISGETFDEYYWKSSDAITVVSTKEDSLPFKGPDGKTYPGGRKVRFIVPDTGNYTIEQRSIKDGCYVGMEKDVHVTFKDPTIPDPYALTPGITDLSIYPSPIIRGGTTNAFISTTTKEMVVLEVMDIEKGNTLVKKEVSGKLHYNVPLDVSNLSPGTYIVQLTTESTFVTYKIVIQ